MEKVYILHHSYEMEGQEQTKLIGVYTSAGEAEAAVARLKNQPGFKDRPDDFIYEAYELNKDHWTEGFSVMTTILVKDIKDNWKPVAAAFLIDGTYEIVEKYEYESLGDFKDGDIVRCEERGDGFYAVEKINGK